MSASVFTVSGLPGSGKTETAKKLCERRELELEYMSPGTFYNNMDSIKDMNVAVDHIYAAMICYLDGVNGFHIFLQAPLETRARRIRERDGGNIEDVIEDLRKREETEVKLGRKICDMDYRNPQFYTMITDTRRADPESIVKMIRARHRIHYRTPLLAEVAAD